MQRYDFFIKKKWFAENMGKFSAIAQIIFFVKSKNNRIHRGFYKIFLILLKIKI